MVLNLFIATIRTTYLNLRATANGRAFLTHGQRKLLQNAQLVLESAPLSHARRPPSSSTALGGLAALAHAAVHSPMYEAATLLLITCAALTLSLRSSTTTPLAAQRTEALCYLITALYTLEVGLRLLADGLDAGCQRGWNAFDAACTACALLGAGLSGVYYSGGGGASGAPWLATDTAVMRAALALRSLRLVAALPQLRPRLPWLAPLMPVLRGAARALPAFLQVLAFFAVVVFMYAVVGMAAFGGVRHGYAGNNAGSNPGRSTGNLNSASNFDTFPAAAWTLFRCYTGEGWNYLMTDLMVAPPYCQPGPGPDSTCGAPAMAPLFFISFMAFTAFALDALMGATVLDAFWLEHPAKAVYVAWEDPLQRRLYNFTHGEAAAFQDAWAAFDPWGDAPGVTREQLASVLALVDAPLGSRTPLGGAGAAAAAAAGCSSSGSSSDSSLEAERGRAVALVRSLGLEEEGGGGGGTARSAGEGCISYHTALFALVTRASTGYGQQACGRLSTAAAPEGKVAALYSSFLIYYNFFI